MPTALTSGSLGGQFLLWETATAVAGYLLGINPFDQPDVESAKKAARGLLDAQPEPEAAAFTDGVVEVRGYRRACWTVWTRCRARSTRCWASSTPRATSRSWPTWTPSATPTCSRPAGAGDRTGRPVTFGWGPRFLHSTGQYHKGGHPQGVFLQITGGAPGRRGDPGPAVHVRHADRGAGRR